MGSDPKPMLTKSKLFQPPNDDCRVTKEDLKRLGQVTELLTLLNDPYIGPYKLAKCIEDLPVLAFRCRREAALHRSREDVENIERALNVLGNRGFEKVLLELLEDMTILKSDLESGVGDGKQPLTSINPAQDPSNKQRRAPIQTTRPMPGARPIQTARPPQTFRPGDRNKSPDKK